MEKTKIHTLLIATMALLFACGDSSNEDTVDDVLIVFNFTHTWDNTIIDSTNLNSITVTNENGEVINMQRLRYLVSRFELENEDGTIYRFNGYKFTDVSDTSTYNFSPENNIIRAGEYTLRFIWGFNEEDNEDGAYADLNGASWNWPPMLGGGYHFLQFDGTYNVNTDTPMSFNFHNGTARVSPDVFEQNFAEIEFSETLTIGRSSSLEIKMNIAEFFRNPNTWNLNELDTPLMPNYIAQKMMQANVMSVFSVGKISNL